METLAGDLLLGLQFVTLEILSTSFIDFLYGKLGELRSGLIDEQPSLSRYKTESTEAIVFRSKQRLQVFSKDLKNCQTVLEP